MKTITVSISENEFEKFDFKEIVVVASLISNGIPFKIINELAFENKYPFVLNQIQ